MLHATELIGHAAHILYYEREKRKETRDVTSHICAQTTQVELYLPKLSCKCGVPDIVNYAMFCQNWFKGFWLDEQSKFAIFLCLVLWLI